MVHQKAITIELISPTKQKAWGWPAVLNFTLGGTGTGYYLVTFLTSIFDGRTYAEPFRTLTGLLAAAIVALGFLGLITEIGRPSRVHHVIRHIAQSWISRETVVGVVFIVTAIFDAIYPHPTLRLFALASALLLMISQGFIVYSARGVRSWNVPIMPVLFVSTGIASGSGLILLFDGACGVFVPHPHLLAASTFLGLNLAVWLLYLRWSSVAPYRSATKSLHRGPMMLLSVGLGHVLPLLLLLHLGHYDLGDRLQQATAITAGVAIIAGVAAQKTGIILASGYMREIALKT